MEHQDFHKETEARVIENTRRLCEDLPIVVSRFVRSIQNSTEAKTRLAYVGDIKNFLEYYCETADKHIAVKDVTENELGEVTKDLIEDYLDYLQHYKKDGKEYTNSRVTIKRKYATLRKFYSFLYKSDLIKSNVVEKVSTPRIKGREIVYMDRDEVSSFLNAVENGRNTTSPIESGYHKKLGQRDRAIATLLLATGLRISECVGLNIDDIDFKNDRIKVIRKGGKESFVYFSDAEAEIMSDYLEYREAQEAQEGHEKALFLSSQRKRITARAVQIMIKKYAIEAVPLKKITPHKLRATFGTALYEETGDIYLTAEALGHNDVNTTRKHYANLSNTRKMEARNAVNFIDADNNQE